MGKDFDYASRARKMSAKYPFLSYLLIQINFWVLANLVFCIISYLQLKLFIHSFLINYNVSFVAFLLLGFGMGLVYGATIGTADFFLDKNFYRKRSLGILLLLKILIALAVLILLFGIIRYHVYAWLGEEIFVNRLPPLDTYNWSLVFFSMLLYYAVIGLMTSFANQMRTKFGPGVLIPMLLGRYSRPKEEKRIFIFMDLKSSTTIAEDLGHMRYSSFIRDAIFDINKLVPQYDAEIYQYVGDEIVVTWRIPAGLKDLNAVHFYFACHDEFERREAVYQEKYGHTPFFKAGMHMGIVSAVEIGDIKRDIAYHGDTINIAARIQAQANVVGKEFLASAKFKQFIEKDDAFIVEEIGSTLLKGKTKNVSIVSIGRKTVG